MIPKKDLESSETPFNMAMLFYMELHELRTIKSKAFLSGDLIGYRDCLEEIFSAISFKLSKKQKQEIKNLFGESEECLNGEKERIYFKTTLRRIDFQLIDFMNSHNMIFPNFEVNNGLTSVLGKYNIKK